ncbi:LytR/AlgR family response regulator transcription factor [Verrucomicrobiota bacterium sgz303538]
MNLRVVLVDDEPLARERLIRLLGNEEGVEIVAECGDGASAVDAVSQHKPNLLLLDIQMPGMDGFDVVHALDPKALPSIVFVTAYDQHAVRAFEARALDYLLKPVSRARLRETLVRARERLQTATPSQSQSLPQALLDFLAERESTAGRVRRLLVRNGERISFVRAEDVDWIEAAGNYALLHTGRESHIIRETMSALEAQLPVDTFLRVSRSAILNLRRVRELQSLAPGEHIAILADGQRVPITRSLREVEDRLRFV